MLMLFPTCIVAEPMVPLGIQFYVSEIIIIIIITLRWSSSKVKSTIHQNQLSSVMIESGKSLQSGKSLLNFWVSFSFPFLVGFLDINHCPGFKLIQVKRQSYCSLSLLPLSMHLDFSVSVACDDAHDAFEEKCQSQDSHHHEADFIHNCWHIAECVMNIGQKYMQLCLTYSWMCCEYRTKIHAVMLRDKQRILFATDNLEAEWNLNKLTEMHNHRNIVMDILHSYKPFNDHSNNENVWYDSSRLRFVFFSFFSPSSVNVITII